MKKISHFYREPIKVIKRYTDEELDRKYKVEDDFQFKALRFIYSTIDPVECIEVIAIAGGSARLSLRAAGKLKMMGVRAGITDLMLLWRNGGIAFIELKAGSYPSVAQKEFLEYLTMVSHLGKVCRTLRDILEFLRKNDLLLRQTSHSS